jgi:hypothetical protein
MELLKFVREHQAIIGALIAGTFALTAAWIRRDRRWEKAGSKRPVMRLLLLPILSLLVGGGLLATEYFVFNLDPDGELIGVNNPGAILCLSGCLLLSAGLIWGVINLFRLMTWPKPADADATTNGEAVPASNPVQRHTLPPRAVHPSRKAKP